MTIATMTSDGHIMWWCPGCQDHHGVPVDGSRGWTLEGSVDCPTIRPSVLVTMTLYGPDKVTFNRYDGDMPCEATKAVCHCFITAGKIEFLNDCWHGLRGQTVPMAALDTPE